MPTVSLHLGSVPPLALNAAGNQRDESCRGAAGKAEEWVG